MVVKRRKIIGLAVGLSAVVALNAVAADASLAPASGGSASTHAAKTIASKASRLKPHMKAKLIPFHHKRKMQTARYSKRHYGKRQYHLNNPRVIVEHYTDGPTMMSAWWTMANNTKNLGESPGVCAHFIINKRGRTYRVVPVDLRCRHTIGLNFTAIGIEHVSFSDHGVMSRKRQRQASYQLTLWLMKRFNIPVKNVIGHGESLMSPYRYERYKSWKCLTHTDFSHHTMHRYRHALRVRARHHHVRVGPKPHWVDIGC